MFEPQAKKAIVRSLYNNGSKTSQIDMAKPCRKNDRDQNTKNNADNQWRWKKKKNKKAQKIM